MYRNRKLAALILVLITCMGLGCAVPIGKDNKADTNINFFCFGGQRQHAEDETKTKTDKYYPKGSIQRAVRDKMNGK